MAVALAKSSRPAAAVDYAIDIVNLSKSFRRKTLKKGGYSTIKSSLVDLIFGGKKVENLKTTVLRDLTLRIPKGASAGVIGRNGSGKSTFLKLITGIYRPDRGSVTVNGRLAALIELGAGFHPDFTGRENLYLGGVMHGMTNQEIADRFDAIVDFAELREVIDDPVRTYSSGMFMRLGFSLAVHTEPDVLLVDEVLSVGDAGFVNKCKEKIANLRREGKTLILVSHDLGAVERWCDEVLWLDGGMVKDRGDPRRVIDHYRQFIERLEENSLEKEEAASSEEEIAVFEAELNTAESEDKKQRWGSREVEITGVRVFDRNQDPRHLFHAEDVLKLEIDYFVNDSEATDVVFGVGINRDDGLHVFGTNTSIERIKVPPLRSRGTVFFEVSRLGLLDGGYFIDVAVHRDDGYPYDYHKNVVKFAIRSPEKQVGVVLLPHKWGF